MLRTLWHRLVGHAPLVWDRLPDGTPIRGCPTCGSYVRRETSDPRPLQATDPRHRLSEREQYEARARAVRTLRAIRLRKERPGLRAVGGR